jgi:hypothetical protein
MNCEYVERRFIVLSEDNSKNGQFIRGKDSQGMAYQFPDVRVLYVSPRQGSDNISPGERFLACALLYCYSGI